VLTQGPMSQLYLLLLNCLNFLVYPCSYWKGKYICS